MMLSVREVAKQLRVSQSWVYRHRDALAGYQPAFGAALKFSQKIINDILEGKHAISDEGRTMESREDDTRPTENQALQNKKRSKKMGGRAARRALAGADKYDLLA